MANAMNQLETKLNDVFGKQAPQLPANGKKMLVDWAPWVSIVVGLLSLWGAWVLLSWANTAVIYPSLCGGIDLPAYTAYPSCASGINHFSLWIWLSVIVLAIEAVLYLVAFPSLRAHKKAGWNLLFYGALVNIVYAVVNLFTGYNGMANFLFALIGSAIGLWLLFQIRPLYLGQRASDSTTSSSNK